MALLHLHFDLLIVAPKNKETIASQAQVLQRLREESENEL